MKEQIEEIKAKISVLSYARDILHFPVRKDGDRYLSLKPSSTNKTCCVFYEHDFYDYNLGVGGDVINLCAYAKYGGDKAPAIRELASLCGISLNRVTNWGERTQNLMNCVQKWHEDLSPEHRKYMQGRGFTDETINKNKIGSYEGNIMIPCFENDYVSYYTKRMYFEGEPVSGKLAELHKDKNLCKYKHMPKNMAPMSELVPWGFHTLNRDEKPLIIAEGVLDAMVCDQEGYQTLSPLGGKFNKTTYKQIISICKRTKEVILCFDNDKNGAGQSFLFEMSKILFNHNIDFWIYEFDDKMDLNEYYQKKKNINAIEKDKIRGVEYLAANIKDKQEFKAFVRNASRFVGTAEIAEVFDIAEEVDNGLKKNWLKEVRKSAMRCPTEDHIINVLNKKKDFLFHPKIGFHEYSSGCWRLREDEEVQSCIADELGHYRSGGKLGSILKLLKTDVVNTEPFNQGNTLNFLNGTLMLDTGELVPHAKEQMSNIQIGYAYDENATCPRWLKFIDEITEFEFDKGNLLQEILGYVLYPDNSLQKAFILIGGGSNGKSVYLEIGRKVYGEGNCTSVEVSNLNEDFQRVRLMNSLLNVSTEMKSSVGGAESIFKGIVAGDTVTGCKKHKDFIDFVPRVKMLCATNQMFKSNDMTHGFIRRLLFVKFNLEFKMTKREAIYSYQRVANLDLAHELEQELAGIFNWCYEGYKRLRKNGIFSESREHKALVRELKNTENPHHMFFEELKKNEYNDIELFDEYTTWCGRKGKLPKGKAELLFLADTATNKKFIKDKVIYMKR